MNYRIEEGRYEGILPDGRIILFEGTDEMLACAEMIDEIMELVGRPRTNMNKIGKILNLSQPVKRKKMKRKKVRIRIDPDVEYLGNEKALA